MNSLNKAAEQTFKKLIDGLQFYDSRKITNSEIFMPVYVQIAGKQGASIVPSVAHYFFE